MGQVAAAIREKLTQAFAPSRLDIVDDSDKHKGHAGHREGGESHFTVFIEAQAFDGTSRVERERLVHKALAEELAGPIHALSVKASPPAS